MRIGWRELMGGETLDHGLDFRWVWSAFEVELFGFGLILHAKPIRRRQGGY